MRKSFLLIVLLLLITQPTEAFKKIITFSGPIDSIFEKTLWKFAQHDIQELPVEPGDLNLSGFLKDLNLDYTSRMMAQESKFLGTISTFSLSVTVLDRDFPEISSVIQGEIASFQSLLRQSTVRILSIPNDPIIRGGSSTILLEKPFPDFSLAKSEHNLMGEPKCSIACDVFRHRQFFILRWRLIVSIYDSQRSGPHKYCTPKETWELRRIITTRNIKAVSNIGIDIVLKTFFRHWIDSYSHTVYDLTN